MSLAPTPHPAAEHNVVARLAAAAPPLTESTRARLAALLRGSQTRPDHFADKVASTIRGGAA